MSAHGSRGPRRWAELTAPELGELLDASPTEVGLLPVGATEQHGPHLPTGTDTVLASALCDEVSARTGAPVLPGVAVGASYGHGTTFPGTLSLSPEQLASSVRAMAEWAAHSGLHRLLVVNGHFGNAAALDIASDHLRMWRPDLRIGVTGWWAADPGVAAEMLLDGIDVHANRAETSLMLAVAPELVRLDLLEAGDDPDRTGGLVFRYTARELSRNGVTGRPSEASADLGKVLFEFTVDRLCGLVERGRLEEPPFPALLEGRR